MFGSHSHMSPGTPEVVPILSTGRHRNPKQGACFMEFASYLAGERWSDRPACTHPLLAALARDVNDLTTDAGRDRLMPLVHRVIGLTSDDPAVTAMIAVRAASAALPVASMERQGALAVGLLAVVASTGSARLEAIARAALDQAPDTERWAVLYLASASVGTRPFGNRAAEAIAHTSVVGIALACVPDPDALLFELLDAAITDTEALVRPALTPTEEMLSLA